MPEDTAPEEPTTNETPVENAPAFAWPTAETPAESTPVTDQTIVEAPIETSVHPTVVEAPVDGAVSPEELAAYSSQPTTPDTAPILDPATPAAPVASVFGAAVPGIDAPIPNATIPKKSPKKKLIILGAIIVGALALLGGGTAAAYNLWYQNPDKVVLEAVSSLLQSGTSTHKVSVDIKTKDTTVTVTLDAKLAESPASQTDIAAKISYSGKDYNVKGSVLTDKDGNLYFKLNDVKTLLTQVAGEGVDLSAFNTVITKVDGQWIKISSSDLKSVSDEYSKTQTCATDALKSLDQKAATDEITAVYKKNDFIAVGDKIGVKDIDGVASLGYKVTLDEAKAKTFYTALGETKVGKALTACDSSFSFKAGDLDSSTDTSKTTNDIQVWSSRFGHQLKELDITSKDQDTTATIVWNPTFVKGVTVSAPTTSIPFSEVTTDAENALTDYYTSLYSSYYSSGLTVDTTSMQQAFKLTSLL
ncbi:MAG TPA: hypothetical protein VIM31_00295 [Candidatus Microsaccharimonas sp.]|jgi:hypothetical protein